MFLGIAIVLVTAQLCCCGQVMEFVESLPTPAPTAVLVDGREYWTGGIELGPLDSYWTSSYSMTSAMGNSAVIGVISDSSRVRLIRRQGDWCYVEVVEEYHRGFVPPAKRDKEGWLKCRRLLDYQPTPLPTKVRTPQRPSE